MVRPVATLPNLSPSINFACGRYDKILFLTNGINDAPPVMNTALMLALWMWASIMVDLRVDNIFSTSSKIASSSSFFVIDLSIGG